MKKPFAFDLQLFADGSNAGGEGNNGGKEPDGGDKKPEEKNDKTFTQADVDEIVSKRLARERKNWETQLEEEKKKAAMSETEKLKAEKEEAEKRVKEAEARAAQKLVLAEAKIQAVALGVKPERVDYAVKLADLSEAVGENGEPDTKAIKAALESVLKDLPELKGAASGGVGTGTNPGEQNTTKNPWKKETFNLTEQAKLLRENPALAERLKAEAKG